MSQFKKRCNQDWSPGHKPSIIQIVFGCSTYFLCCAMNELRVMTIKAAMIIMISCTLAMCSSSATRTTLDGVAPPSGATITTTYYKITNAFVNVFGTHMHLFGTLVGYTSGRPFNWKPAGKTPRNYHEGFNEGLFITTIRDSNPTSGPTPHWMPGLMRRSGRSL